MIVMRQKGFGYMLLRAHVLFSQHKIHCQHRTTSNARARLRACNSKSRGWHHLSARRPDSPENRLNACLLAFPPRVYNTNASLFGRACVCVVSVVRCRCMPFVVVWSENSTDTRLALLLLFEWKRPVLRLLWTSSSSSSSSCNLGRFFSGVVVFVCVLYMHACRKRLARSVFDVVATTMRASCARSECHWTLPKRVPSGREKRARSPRRMRTSAERTNDDDDDDSKKNATAAALTHFLCYTHSLRPTDTLTHTRLTRLTRLTCAFTDSFSHSTHSTTKRQSMRTIPIIPYAMPSHMHTTCTHILQRMQNAVVVIGDVNRRFGSFTAMGKIGTWWPASSRSKVQDRSWYIQHRLSDCRKVQVKDRSWDPNRSNAQMKIDVTLRSRQFQQ